MGREGFSTLRVLMCALLVAVHFAHVNPVKALTIFDNRCYTQNNMPTQTPRHFSF